VVDDHDVVRQGLRLGHEVRGEHHGHPVRGQLTDEVPDGTSRLGVQPRARLVEEDQAGTSDEGHGEREALPLTAGQPSHGGARERAQAEALRQLAGVDRVRVHARDVLEHVTGSLRVRQPAVLEHHADQGTQGRRVVRGVEAQDPHVAAVAMPETLADLDGRRLAGAVGAEHRGHPSGLRDQVEPLDRDVCAVALEQPRHLDGWGERHGRDSIPAPCGVRHRRWCRTCAVWAVRGRVVGC
jgi:hypothetical protein